MYFIPRLMYTPAQALGLWKHLIHWTTISFSEAESCGSQAFASPDLFRISCHAAENSMRNKSLLCQALALIHKTVLQNAFKIYKYVMLPERFRLTNKICVSESLKRHLLAAYDVCYHNSTR